MAVGAEDAAFHGVTGLVVVAASEVRFVDDNEAGGLHDGVVVGALECAVVGDCGDAGPGDAVNVLDEFDCGGGFGAGFGYSVESEEYASVGAVFAGGDEYEVVAPYFSVVALVVCC